MAEVGYCKENGSSGLYRPLDAVNQEIRLIRLLPESTAICLHLEIESFSVNSEVEYTALSYYWGEHPANRTIFINDVRVLIRPNLFEYLQNRWNESQQGWLFIDAVCINQDDIVERAQQVGLMGKVFRNANHVDAWIDVETPIAPSVLGEWQYFADLAFRTVVSRHDQDNGEKGASPEEATRKLLTDPDMASIAGELIPTLSKARFWTRLWVVQEVMLARSLTLRLQSLRLDWRVALYLAGHAAERLWQGYTSHRLTLVAPLFSTAEELNDLGMRALLMLDQKHNFAGRMDLASAIATFGALNCSIVHDKIYGIIGMTQCEMPIDYHMPVIEIFVWTLMETLFEICSDAGQSSRSSISIWHEDPERSIYRDLQGLCYTLPVALGLDPHHPMIQVLIELVFQCFLQRPDLEWLRRPFWTLSPPLRSFVSLRESTRSLKRSASETIARFTKLLAPVQPWTYQHTGRRVPPPYPGCTVVTRSDCENLVERTYQELMEKKSNGIRDFNDLFQQVIHLPAMDENQALALVDRITKTPFWWELFLLTVETLRCLLITLESLVGAEAVEGSIQLAVQTISRLHYLLDSTAPRLPDNDTILLHPDYYRKYLHLRRKQLQLFRNAARSRNAKFAVLRRAMEIYGEGNEGLRVESDEGAGMP